MRRTITIEIELVGDENHVEEITDDLTRQFDEWENTGGITRLLGMEIDDDSE